MTSEQVTLSGFDEFAPKALLIALAKFEGTLSPELIAEVNQVGAAVVGGDMEKASQFIDIAKKDAAFYEVFEQAYEDLLELDDTNEKDKWLPELDANTPSRQTTDDFNNFLAPPLTDANPQSKAKKLFSGVRDLVERVYGLRF
ncbi:MAG: hypothetical protein JGK17_22020 [Microcoleus sp. PH2017_10_PVI_O_A]|uniref:hypothetical protein n=1 Tax=unclassified Microcoleus TaxID=2642155 RepID=UPI001DB0463A|nr:MULTISPECIES: hypothetical protein [unclassified Microcoleus]TAE79532.1 MAG: hypothetical protein EAZ83_21115 [Oscillatoriales cyanobacterium]MCC3408214.1 hypothetical protein [Microcoleus sp. PH2017_10_PVI_O_A]MCC3462284.1 hypothetical protein [Microcoleus sp. PH2017_11_PCY_U_A]MCC3480759.1 hypothetical protein [Microcoleus sp. PH2017_12_PCY_D_A]MCC3530685.1 hypothetical protein [Microcoleus sp. PH2017_21_RUC_O_A]